MAPLILFCAPWILRLSCDVNGPDSHPAGDPNGLVPEELLKTLIVNRIHYNFARITHYTDIMAELFKGVYDQAAGAANFTLLNYGADATNFMPVMLKSITSSMARLYRSSSSSSDGEYGKIELPEVDGE